MTETPLWVLILPFGGSVLLFVASIVTLAVTIKSTNKRAKDDRDAAQQRANDDRDAAQARANADREAARERADADRRASQERANADREATQTREFNAWRRDAIVKSATDAVNAAIEAHDYYPTVPGKLGSIKKVGDPKEPIISAAKVIAFSAQTLGLVGAKHAAAECQHMRNAVLDFNLWELAEILARGGDPVTQAHERFERLREDINLRGNRFATAVEEELRTVLPPLSEFPYSSTPDGRPPDPTAEQSRYPLGTTW